MQDFSCRTRIHCTATIAFVARYSFESLAPLLGYTACFEALSNSYGSLHLSSDDDDEELQEFDWRQVGECRERQDFPQSQSSQRGRCGGRGSSLDRGGCGSSSTGGQDGVSPMAAVSGAQARRDSLSGG